MVRSETEARALDRSLLRGVAWTAAARWASQALTWVSWLIVARLLSPEDYGLVGMAAIYLGGIAQLAVLSGNLMTALRLGSQPFLLPDLLKLVVVGLLLRRTASSFRARLS